MHRQLVFRLEELITRQTNVRTILLVDATHVFLEVRQLEERGRAELTLERLFSRVQPNVQLEGRRVRKCLFAYFTLVRSLSSVRPHVDFELGSLCKTVTARFATERLFVRVSTQMLKEMSLEGSLANGALEGLHAAVVAAQVFTQTIGTGKSFAANWTRVIPFARVPSQMHFEVGRAGETLIALVALIRPFAGVSPLVLQQLAATRELFPAVVAGVGFLAGMDAKVNNETLFDRESLATNFATKRFETRVTSQMGLESAHLSKRLLTYVTFEPVE